MPHLLFSTRFFIHACRTGHCSRYPVGNAVVGCHHVALVKAVHILVKRLFCLFILEATRAHADLFTKTDRFSLPAELNLEVHEQDSLLCKEG